MLISLWVPVEGRQHWLVKILVISLSLPHKICCWLRWSSLSWKLCKHLPQHKGKCKTKKQHIENRFNPTKQGSCGAPSCHVFYWNIPARQSNWAVMVEISLDMSVSFLRFLSPIYHSLWHFIIPGNAGVALCQKTELGLFLPLGDPHPIV